jgi:acetyl-CoA C-acetyltransferase
MNAEVRRVAVLGGMRIPFARQNGPYARASNQDMLTATLNALADRFGLAGETIGEVVAGAVLKHSRDFNLTRESVLGSALSAQTPAYDVQQACGTGLEAVVLVANKIALGQIDCGIAGGVDTTSDAPLALNEDLRTVLLDLSRARSNGQRLKAVARLRPGQLAPEVPRNVEPRTGLSMGEHCAIMAAEWGIARAEQDALAAASHNHLAAAYDAGFYDDLVVPYLGLERDQNLRPGSTVETLAKLKPVFGGADGTMTAGNSTPLSDGASTVLLASEQWAAERGIPVLAYFTEAQTAAVDYVHTREGLLMAPARCRTSTCTRSTKRSPPRSCARSQRGRTRCSADNGSSETNRWVRSTAIRSTSTAVRSAPGTHSGRPAAGSSRRSRRRCTSGNRPTHPPA